MSTLGQLFDEAFARYGPRNYAVCMDRFMSYAELDRLSWAFGAWLQSRGVARGARVAIMLPNVLQFPVVLAGALRAGCVVVTVNPLYTPRELEHQLRDSGAEAIVVLENFAHVLAQVLPRVKVPHVVVTSMGELFPFPKRLIVDYVVRRVKKLVPPFELPGAVRLRAALARGAAHGLEPAACDGSDIAFLQYTGGTTGPSKGAILTHRNVIAAILQFETAIEVAEQGRQVPEQLNTITALPLYHSYALTACGLLGLRRGNLLTLIPNPRDIPALVAELAKRPFHAFPALNTLFVALTASEDFRKLDFSPLMLTAAGGMATQKAVADRWQQITGCVVSEGWGMSETCSAGTFNSPNAPELSETIGMPLPSIEIVIRDDDNRDLPVGEPGELCIRGPNVTQGYYGCPDETARAMTPDGYFRTGDIGTMDERGEFRIVDRKKDMIIVSGFNVFPSEIEAVVCGHPKVAECAAIGVPDPASGEAVKLYVVRRDPALTEDALRGWCRDQLTGYKRPRSIEFRTELPKSPVGKVLKRELRG